MKSQIDFELAFWSLSVTQSHLVCLTVALKVLHIHSYRCLMYRFPVSLTAWAWFHSSFRALLRVSFHQSLVCSCPPVWGFCFVNSFVASWKVLIIFVATSLSVSWELASATS